MPFDFAAAPLPGMVIVTPRTFPDGRGMFMETWNRAAFRHGGIDEVFVQDNHSVSAEGVLRGLHYQCGEDAQGKLVRVTAGTVWDVGVDIREDSPHFGRWFGMRLDAVDHQMLYIPPGFAHGFLALEAGSHVQYKCTREYVPEADAGIRWDDPELGIEWPLPAGRDVVVSEKDAALPLLKDMRR